MKKWLLILTVAIMVCGSVLNVSAAENTENIPNAYPIMQEYASHGLQYAYIYKYKPVAVDVYVMYLTENMPFYKNAYVTVDGGKYAKFNLIDGQWVLEGDVSDGANIHSPSSGMVWTNTDINSQSGGLYFAHDPNFFPRPLHQIVLEVAGNR